jgi:hypothetical protein
VYGADILSLMKGKEIFRLIAIRHKIVHHSARVDGKKIMIRETGILEAMNSISRWVENIEFYLSKKKERKSFPNYARRYFKQGDIRKSEIYKRAMSEMIARSLKNMDDSIKKKEMEQHIYWH